MPVRVSARKVCSFVIACCLIATSLPADEAADIEERLADPLTRVYPMADLLGKIQAGPRKRFKIHPGKSPSLSAAEKAARQKLVEMLKVRTVNGKPQAVVRWFGEALVISAKPREHKRVAALMEHWRTNGLREIRVEVKMIRAPAKLIHAIEGNWKVSKDVSADAGVGVPGRNFGQKLNGEHAAETVSRQNLPILLQTVSRESAARLVGDLTRNSAVQSLAGPRVSLLNDQQATIHDVSQRPFVVGLENGVPQLSVVSTGLQLRVSAKLEGGRVSFLGEVSYSQVTDVETRTLGPELSGAPRKIQIPHVLKSVVQTGDKLTPGQCHLVGGIPIEPRGGKPYAMLLLIRAYASQQENAIVPFSTEHSTSNLLPSPARPERSTRSIFGLKR